MTVHMKCIRISLVYATDNALKQKQKQIQKNLFLSFFRSCRVFCFSPYVGRFVRLPFPPLFLGENQNQKAKQNKREREGIIITAAMLCIKCDDLTDETIQFVRLLVVHHHTTNRTYMYTHSKRWHYLTIFRSYFFFHLFFLFFFCSLFEYSPLLRSVSICPVFIYPLISIH